MRGGIGETGEDGTARIATPDIIADLDEGIASGFVVPESQDHVVEAVIVTRGQGKGECFYCRCRSAQKSTSIIIRLWEIPDENCRADRVYPPPVSTNELLMPANTKEIGKVFMISKKVQKDCLNSMAAVSSVQLLIRFCHHLPSGMIFNSIGC